MQILIPLFCARENNLQNSSNSFDEINILNKYIGAKDIKVKEEQKDNIHTPIHTHTHNTLS